MIEVISSAEYRAKKEYNDDGWEYITECGWFVGISFAQKRALVKYRKDRHAGRKILPGDLYVRQFNKCDGTTYVWRTKKVFFEIICKLDLFPDV